MLQILDDGMVTDAKGRKIDFKNTVIVMTSNIGAKNITEQKRFGFAPEEDTFSKTQDNIRNDVMAELKRNFRPEFLNRIDDIIVFKQLNKEDIKQIAVKMTDSVIRRLSDMGISLTVDDSAIELLSEKGFDVIYGARPLRRAIQSMLEDKVSEKMLEGVLTNGSTAVASAEDGKIVFK